LRDIVIMLALLQYHLTAAKLPPAPGMAQYGYGTLVF
jgi:hypothetical protein